MCKPWFLSAVVEAESHGRFLLLPHQRPDSDGLRGRGHGHVAWSRRAVASTTRFAKLAGCRQVAVMPQHKGCLNLASPRYRLPEIPGQWRCCS